jgi:uncharacterized protein
MGSMPQLADTLDVDTLQLRSGSGARFDARVRIDPVSAGGQEYRVAGDGVDARVDISRTSSGYAFKLSFDALLEGPCMRCLADARPQVRVEAREVEQPGEAEDFHSPYFDEGILELAGWARDALVLALPPRLLCREECRGLCPVCGESLNEADPEQHRHERPADRRWAKLSELELE